MISFENDYSEGAHPEILRRLTETNMEQTAGYGTDPYTASAAEKIRTACGCPEAEVFFLAGGTQTNQVVIDAMLAPYEGVIAATTGHVNCHEAGAIEFTGHKVLTVPHYDGKLHARDVDRLVEAFWQDGSHEHMVFPGMVYISQPTEYGTLYRKEELEALAAVCRKHKLPLFVDGARLGYGLMSRENDVTLPELAELCDVFYIGGTKVGALLGEAVVFTKRNAPAYFMTRVKQHGAMLAKGRVIGIQFDTLFTGDLYFKAAAHAIAAADYLKEGLRKLDITFFIDSPTNQQFVVLDNKVLAELEKSVRFSRWEPVDRESSVVRFATSWATPRENVDFLLNRLKELLGK